MSAWSDGLRGLYSEYVTTCSTKKMAISLQSAEAIAELCILRRPGTVLDFGSGLSTATLGYVKKLGLATPIVESVDSSSEWLGKTRSFLEAHRLQVERLTALDDFSFERRFDFIIHDIGDMGRRAQLLPHMWSMLNPGGWMMLDDFHKPKYRKSAEGFLSNVDHARDEPLSQGTMDQFKRYALFVQKSASASSS